MTPEKRCSIPETIDPAVMDRIQRYCATCWVKAGFIDPHLCEEATQEVFLCLLERIPLAEWHQAINGNGKEKEELLRVIDAVKKRCLRSPYRNKVRTGQKKELGIVQDASPSSARAELEELLQGCMLSERQTEVLRRTADGWTTSEIAEHLSLSLPIGW